MSDQSGRDGVPASTSAAGRPVPRLPGLPSLLGGVLLPKVGDVSLQRGGWDGNSNEPLLHDHPDGDESTAGDEPTADDEDEDVEGFGFSIGVLKPEGPPIRGVLDGIALPSFDTDLALRQPGEIVGRTGGFGNANEPVVDDRDR